MIRDFRLSDLPAIRTILEAWMRDESGHSIRHDDVEQALSAMTKSVTSGDPIYVVAEDEHAKAVGIGGLTTVGIDPHFTDGAGRPVELINVYVTESKRGRGLGTLLVDELEERARLLGSDVVIVVSGSRNREFGYPFWDGRFGERFRTDADYFGPDAERVVWRKTL